MMSFSFHYNDIHMPFFPMTSCLFSFYSDLLSLRARPIGFFTLYIVIFYRVAHLIPSYAKLSRGHLFEAMLQDFSQVSLVVSVF